MRISLKITCPACSTEIRPVARPRTMMVAAWVPMFPPIPRTTGMKQAKSLLDNVEYSSDPYACADGADALVILTEWDEFRALDVDRVRAKLKNPILVDLRNIYRPEEMARQAFTYVSVGRATARKED